MSQNDYTIANQSASNARADINNALQALASCSSGSSAPSTTYANMLWYDTGTNILKMRSEADDAWISLNYLNQSANTNNILDNTQVVSTGGTQTGLIGDQAQSVWSAGSGTTESLISPAKLKGAIDSPEDDMTILQIGLIPEALLPKKCYSDLSLSTQNNTSTSMCRLAFGVVKNYFVFQ